MTRGTQRWLWQSIYPVSMKLMVGFPAPAHMLSVITMSLPFVIPQKVWHLQLIQQGGWEHLNWSLSPPASEGHLVVTMTTENKNHKRKKQNISKSKKSWHSFKMYLTENFPECFKLKISNFFILQILLGEISQLQCCILDFFLLRQWFLKVFKELRKEGWVNSIHN